jgi:hypothetical protein
MRSSRSLPTWYKTMSDTVAHHKTLAAGRWQTLSLVEQLGNVGSEVGRAIRAKSQHNDRRMWAALERALELFDLTAVDPRHTGRRREVLRAREVVCDFLVGDNEYGSTAESLDRYFLQFAAAARSGR